MSKPERKSKLEIRSPKIAALIRISNFGLLSGVGFRVSDFLT